MIRRGLRALEIVWTFLRHGVVGSVYRDVVRSHLTNPNCGCEADEAVSDRARRLREAPEALGPTFVKLGQFLSRRPNLVPPAYLHELTRLQDRTPPVPYGDIRARLEEVCICGHRDGRHEARSTCLHCRGVDKVFDGFEREPVASASLAQVHRARYGGREVAVKVLKPGILDRLNLDLSLLDRSRWIVRRLLGVERNMPVSEFVDEFRRRLLEEVNFENEAINMGRFRDTHPDDGMVVAPDVYWEFDCADLLVMDYLEGTALSRWSGSPDAARGRNPGRGLRAAGVSRQLLPRRPPIRATSSSRRTAGSRTWTSAPWESWSPAPGAPSSSCTPPFSHMRRRPCSRSRCWPSSIRSSSSCR